MKKNTKNIKFVAYLRLQGIHPAQVEKIQRGKARYHFEIEDIKWDELRLEFDKSIEFKYAQCLEAVQDLAY